MKDSKMILIGVCVVAFFALALVIVFDDGFKQGVTETKECLDNGGLVVITYNSFNCEKNFTKDKFNFNYSWGVFG